MIAKLLFKGLRYEWVRILVAILGVGAATGLIVWSLGITVTAMKQSDLHAASMTQPYNYWLSTGSSLFQHWRRGSPPPVRRAVVPPHLDQHLLGSIKGLAELKSSRACHVRNLTIDYRPGGRVMQGPPMGANITVATPAGSPYTSASFRGRWPDPAASETEAAVVTAIFTPRRLELPPLGSPLVLVTSNGTQTVKITGYIDMPRTGAGFPTIFTSAAAVERLFGEGSSAAAPNLLLCDFNQSSDIMAKIDATIAANETTHGPLAGAALNSRRQLAASLMSDELMNFKRQAPLLLTLAVLTAFCMLFNALTIGIEQRLRLFGMLRTIGMTSRQVVQLVVMEGLLIAFSGWLLGLAGGAAVVWSFIKRSSSTFPAGIVSLGWITPLATAAGVVVIALLTLLWVCRKALRIHPLDYLALDRNDERPLQPLRSAIGLLLLFPMLIFVLPLPISAKVRSLLILFLGLPLHAIGLYLVLPLFVRTLERLAAPPLALLLRLDPRLLQRRSSRHYPRTAGMILTLAVGLGSFVSIHIWGGSLMASFMPSKEFPDVIVSLLPQGVATDSAAKVANLEGVADSNCLSIEAVQVDFSRQLSEQANAIDPKPPGFANALIMGVDPLAAFGGPRPLAANFKYVAGERESVADALQSGDACIITLMLARATGLKVGDMLTLDATPPHLKHRRGGPPGGASAAPPGAGRRPPPGADAPPPAEKVVAFKVAAIVDLNWHLVTSRANLRGRNGAGYGTLGPVFIEESKARELSGNHDKCYHLWANLSDSYTALGALPAGQRLEAEIRRTLAVDDSNTIRVHHRDEIADGTLAHGNSLLGDMARAPFWSLIVLSTGLVTLLVAAVRASARELAIMRMVGMTRNQLGRLLLGEALTAAIGGIVLSLLSGFCIGWTFTGWTRAAMPFAGLPLSITIPWAVIGRGTLFALLLSALMTLPPIVWLVRHGLERESSLN